MIDKEEFLTKLEIGLQNHPKKNEIIKEYELHITELLNEKPCLGISQTDMDYIIERLGTPEEILEYGKKKCQLHLIRRNGIL
jgi:uncharacterized membrane protein